MRNHTYATFAYLKDKDFFVFKFFEIAYTRFCHLFQVRLPFVVMRFCKVIEKLTSHWTYKALSQAEFECFVKKTIF